MEIINSDSSIRNLSCFFPSARSDFSLKLMRHCLAVQPMKKAQTAIVQWQTRLQGQALKNLFQERMEGGRAGHCYTVRMEDKLGVFLLFSSLPLTGLLHLLLFASVYSRGWSPESQQSVLALHEGGRHLEAHSKPYPSACGAGVFLARVPVSLLPWEASADGTAGQQEWPGSGSSF